MAESPLRVLRERRGLSQSEVARRCGVSRTAVRSWEEGENAPGMMRALRYAEALGITASQLQSMFDQTRGGGDAHAS